MGCAQSRDEARQAAFGSNFNTVPYAFKSVDNTSFDALHPWDAIVASYLGGVDKEAKDAAFGELKEGKFEKPEAFKAPATKLFNELKALHEWAKANVDEAKPSAWEKYNRKQVTDDLDGVLTLIAGCYEELKWPEEAAAADAAPKKEGEPAAPAEADAPAENEGGDADLGAVLVKAFCTHPVFADLVKSAVVKLEVVPAFDVFASMTKIDVTFGLAAGQPAVDCAFAAALIFFFVNSQEKAGVDKEVWFSANFTDEDKAELDDALAGKDTKSLIFPGVIEVFGEEAEAAGKVSKAEGDAKAKHQITFKYLKGNYFEQADKHLLIARFCAQVTEKSEDGKVYTLGDAAGLNFESVALWKEKATAAAPK